MVSTHLKNISQNGNLPQIGMKINNIDIWNQHLVLILKVPYLGDWHVLIFLWNFLTASLTRKIPSQKEAGSSSNQPFSGANWLLVSGRVIFPWIKIVSEKNLNIVEARCFRSLWEDETRSQRITSFSKLSVVGLAWIIPRSIYWYPEKLRKNKKNISCKP